MSGSISDLDRELLRSLAAFRYQLRTFLHFSEDAAHAAGLQPQQHQLLLQVAGAEAGTAVTIAWAAERLGLRHNSTVELVDRSVKQGLLRRAGDPADGRRVVLSVTRGGEHLLHELSAHHAGELYEQAPVLLRALRRVGRHARPPRTAPSRRIERSRA